MGMGTTNNNQVYYDSNTGQYYTNSSPVPWEQNRTYLTDMLGGLNKSKQSAVSENVARAQQVLQNWTPPASISQLFPALQSSLPQAQTQNYYVGGKQVTGLPTNFNAEAYLSMYPDLQAAFGNNPNLAAQHYMQYGRGENRAAPTYAVQEYQAMPMSSGAGRFLTPSQAQATGGVLNTKA